MNERRVQGIAGAQRNVFPAVGADQRGTEAISMFLDLLEAVLNEVSRNEVVLHIRCRAAGGGLNESAGLAHVCGQGAGLESHVAD